MKVVVYPADRWGCGSHRLIWPAEELQRRGHDVAVVSTKNRQLEMVIDNRTDTVAEIKLPDDVDVVVFQRTTHRYLAQAIGVIRRTGRTVVVDVDDDLSSIHPSNPAWQHLHPRSNERTYARRGTEMHTWSNLGLACREASLVVTTTPALVEKYGHGHGVVIPNYLADHYYGVSHEDGDVLGWPASLTSHPNDPEVVGNAVARLVDAGHRFKVTSVAPGVGRAFGLPDDAVETADRVIDLHDWPTELTKIGVGITPLADTKFNTAKSWLKPLELAAVGVPWVGSPRAEYRRLHRLGCGVLADRPKDWFRVLRSLLTNDSRRRELSAAGRAVAATLRLRDHAHEWWEAWSEAYDRDQAAHRQAV